MKRDCLDFRARLHARLIEALRGPDRGRAADPLAPGIAAALGWPSHVMHCAECRELLAQEEALEELLRSLPEPRLPRALAERVLSRLEGERRAAGSGDLDRLLELTHPEPAPSGLARGVLARVRAERDLDRLLDKLPVETPAGLERRVLARLSLARRGPPAPATKSPRTVHPAAAPARHTFAYRIAAGLAVAALATWGFVVLRKQSASAPGEDPAIAHGGTPPVVRPQDPALPEGGPENVNGNAPGNLDPVVQAPDEELLASLEMLEAWDLFSNAAGSSTAGSTDATALDAAFATLDSTDEYLLDFGAAADATAVPGTKENGAGDGSVKKG